MTASVPAAFRTSGRSTRREPQWVHPTTSMCGSVSTSGRLLCGRFVLPRLRLGGGLLDASPPRSATRRCQIRLAVWHCLRGALRLATSHSRIVALWGPSCRARRGGQPPWAGAGGGGEGGSGPHVLIPLNVIGTGQDQRTSTREAPAAKQAERAIGGVGPWPTRSAGGVGAGVRVGLAVEASGRLGALAQALLPTRRVTFSART